VSTTADLSVLFVDEAAALVRARTGLVVGPARTAAFRSALADAMRSARVSDPVVYLADLAVTPALMDDLAGRVTVGETYFFRDPDQFALIEQEVLPALLRSRTSDSGPLRLWSAGCATGEEAYTLAILASRVSARARTVGTDISRRALAKARSARYTRWSFRGVAEDVVAGHFDQVDDEFELHREYRDVVEFRYLNLADAGYPSAASGIVGMDLILCRNVLIYFDQETVARVADQLLRSLAADGWLVLGASDPMLADLVSCHVVVSSAGLMYRRTKGAAVSFASILPPPRAHLAPTPAVVAEPPAPALEPVRLETVQNPVPASDAEVAARCYAVRDYDGAAEAARRAVGRPGAEAGVSVLLVRALANGGELGEAERACALALERHGMSAELCLLHASLLTAARRYDAAAVAARKALYLDRGLALGHLAHGAALAGLEDVPGARSAFTNAATLLAGVPRDGIVPASGGEAAGRLADLVGAELELLTEAAA